MKVSKKFRWEGAHRLAWHNEGCQHLHGHSYILWVEVEGPADEKGMVIDFKVISQVLKPLIEEWDHATLISKDDSILRKAIDLLGSKFAELPYDTTSENLCRYVTDYLLERAAQEIQEHCINKITVRLQETESCYAELSTAVDVAKGATKKKLAEEGTLLN